MYGADSAIRRWAERHRLGYVLAVTSGQRLGLRPVTRWIENLPEGAWQRLSAGEGAKGPRLYDWAYLPHNGGAVGFRCTLLVQRSISKPEEITFCLTHAPEQTGLAELVRIAGMRWSVERKRSPDIESLFEQAKGEAGLDHYEVRSWVGWHRHVTLAMLALAFLAAVRRAAIGGRGHSEPGSRPVATDRARGQALAGSARRLAASAARHRPALVSMAPTPPAARTQITLAPQNTATPT